MYKDKSKQKQANKAANKRYRDKQKGITAQGDTEGITEQIPEISDTSRDTASQEPRQSTNRTATLQDYLDNPDDYIGRREPERMNWGAWLNMDELKQAGFKCNRVPIPGDWDYQGSAQPTTAAPVDECPKPGSPVPVSLYDLKCKV